MADFERNIVPQNPVEVAIPFAYDIIFDKSFDEFKNSQTETLALRELNEMVRNLDMLGAYRVRTDLAFALPEVLEPDEDGIVTVHRMDKETEFDGVLLGGRTLKIGRIVNEIATRAVCLTFEDVLVRYRRTVDNSLLYTSRKFEQSDRMYVPVFAVNDMKRTD